VSRILNDVAQWAMEGRGGPRTAEYESFNMEKSNLIRQAAIEARLAQLRYRQGR
jgi:hypothetical protein